MLPLSQLPSVPYSLSNSSVGPASSKLSWAGGAQAWRSCGGTPMVPLRRPSAAGHLPGAAGYEVKEWTKATAQLLQWHFSYADLWQEHNLWPCSCFWTACFLGYLQHCIHMYDTSHTGTAHVHTAHEASKFPITLNHKAACQLRAGLLLLCTPGVH